MKKLRNARAISTQVFWHVRCPRCGAVVGEARDSCCGFPAQRPTSLDQVRGEFVRVAHLSDLHVGKEQRPVSEFDVLHMWLGEFAEWGVHVVAVSGDLSEVPDDVSALLKVRHALHGSGLPYVVVPGNHDVMFPGRLEAFTSVFPEARFPDVQSVGHLDLLLFDSMAGHAIVDRGMMERCVAQLGRLGIPRSACFTEGSIGPAQFSAMEGLLAERPLSQVRLALTHHHLSHQAADPLPIPVVGSLLDEHTIGTMRSALDARALEAWMEKHGVLAVLHGHKHQMQSVGRRHGGTLVFNAGSSTVPTSGRRKVRLLDVYPGGDVAVTTLEMTAV